MDAVGEQTKWAIVGVVIFAATLLMRKLQRSGLFVKVKLSEKDFQGASVVIRTYRGPYKNVGKHFGNLMTLLKEHLARHDTRVIGMYHDNPEEVDPNDCRASVGVILDGPLHGGIEKLLLEKEGYERIDIPRQKKALYTEFPFTGLMSVLLSIWKVYGAFKLHMEKHEDASKFQASHYEITALEKGASEGITCFYFPRGENPAAIASHLKES